MVVYHKLSTIDVTIASGVASLFGTGALLITTSSIRITILHIILSLMFSMCLSETGK